MMKGSKRDLHFLDFWNHDEPSVTYCKSETTNQLFILMCPFVIYVYITQIQTHKYLSMCLSSLCECMLLLHTKN